jgi:hypothetical protein
MANYSYKTLQPVTLKESGHFLVIYWELCLYVRRHSKEEILFE